MRVIVADDSVLLREGVTRLLENAGFEVVGHAGDREELMRKVRAHQARRRGHRHPHAADPHRRGPAGRVRDPKGDAGHGRASCCRHTSRRTYALELLGDDPAGVGYLLKDRVWDGDRFADAVRRVAEGGSALDPEVVSHMLGRRRVREPLEELTPREHEVLALMAEGRSNQAIADALVISGRAVEKHVSSIFTKLDLPPAPEDHRRVLAVLAFLRS